MNFQVADGAGTVSLPQTRFITEISPIRDHAWRRAAGFVLTLPGQFRYQTTQSRNFLPILSFYPVNRTK